MSNKFEMNNISRMLVDLKIYESRKIVLVSLFLIFWKLTTLWL